MSTIATTMLKRISLEVLVCLVMHNQPFPRSVKVEKVEKVKVKVKVESETEKNRKKHFESKKSESEMKKWKK